MFKYFPTKESLKKHLQRQGTHDKILVEHFYTCLKECSDEDDANFAYHTEMFSLFGPLLQLYNDATR